MRKSRSKNGTGSTCMKIWIRTFTWGISLSINATLSKWHSICWWWETTWERCPQHQWTWYPVDHIVYSPYLLTSRTLTRIRCDLVSYIWLIWQEVNVLIRLNQIHKLKRKLNISISLLVIWNKLLLLSANRISVIGLMFHTVTQWWRQFYVIVSAEIAKQWWLQLFQWIKPVKMRAFQQLDLHLDVKNLLMKFLLMNNLI